MLITKRNQSSRFRLGELFLEAGIISPDVLNQGLVIAKRATLPLGRVLVMSGHVSELDVVCALQTQTSIRDGAIDVKMAKALLRFAHVHQVTIDEAYRLNGIGRGVGPLPRLGKLLLAAAIVDDAGLACALRHSKSTGYPLGRALVSLQLISESLYAVCLNLQVMIREQHIEFLKAVRVLQTVVRDRVAFDIALNDEGVQPRNYRVNPRLGDLLVEAGLLSREDALIVAELACEKDDAFGKLLVQHNLSSELVVESAVHLQRMLLTSSITKQRAIRLLNLVHSMNAPLEKILNEFDVLDQIVTLLRAAGVIDERTIRDTAASIKNFEVSVAEALISQGIVTREMSRCGLVLLKEIERGVVTYEKALEVLRTTKPHEQPWVPSEMEWQRVIDPKLVAA